jgi:hypothetical protein
MGRRGRAIRGVISGASAFAAVAVALLMVLPSSTVAEQGTHLEPSLSANCPGVTASYGVVANVTWNGVDVCGSTNQSSALAVDFTQTANLVYSWHTTGGLTGPGTLTLNDARLEMFYFGYSIVTRDVTTTGAVPESSGTFSLNWNPGTLTYVFEGLFGLTASLIAVNGTTVWSENFFIKATAPYSILAALPIILGIIAIWELYSVARSGRQAATSSKAPSPPPPTAPPPSAPASPPEASGGTSEPPPPAEAPPEETTT